MLERAKIAETFNAPLLDPFSIFFRSFHALPRMTTSRGVPTSARYGFAALVLKLLTHLHPTFADILAVQISLAPGTASSSPVAGCHGVDR